MMAEQYLKHPLAGKKFTGAVPAAEAAVRECGNAGTSDYVLDTLQRVLTESGAYGWQITDTKTRGWEFYFIRHRLDQNRVKNTEHITARVYVRPQNAEGEADTVGDSSTEIPPTASEAEIRRQVDRLLRQAALIHNPAYTLNPAVSPEAARDLARKMEEARTSEEAQEQGAAPQKGAAQSPAAEGSGAGTAGKPAGPETVSGDLIRLMQSLPETPTEDVNSYEIFADHVTRRMITSAGTDVTETYPESALEVVTNARRDGHEIEMYRMFRAGTCGTAGLKRELEAQLLRGKDRLRTVPTPDLKKAPVVFSSFEMLAICQWFLDSLDAASVVRGISSWKPGVPAAESYEGDRMTIRAVRFLPDSPENRLLDPEGAPVEDLTLMRDGIPEHYWGSRQYAERLGIGQSFQLTNTVFSGGSQSAEEIRHGNFLEVVEFSDFQVSAMTGDIAGEIRLAYWHENGRVTPVSGGSVSGSMKDFIRTMTMTRESRQYGSMRVPAAVRLEGVTISGIAEI